jgi:predicted dehydrogenase
MPGSLDEGKTNVAATASGKVKWGVIGSGGIARRRTIPEGIVPARNAELVAAYDLNASVNQPVAREYGASPCGSLSELLGAGAEAIYIATPPGRHLEQTIACARAGKAVLCEKPLGLTVAETRTMMNACREAGVSLGTAFMMRFQAQHQAALRLIRSGRLGQPVFARAQLSCWYPPIPGAWRQDPAQGGGGSLMDMGGHCIDLLEMFFGNVRAVNCVIGRSVHEYPSEDSAVAMLTFENGAFGVVDTFFCIPDEASRNVLELYGSKGSILARGTIGQGEKGEMMAQLSEAEVGYDAQQARAAAGGMPIEPEPVNMYRAEIEEFSLALLERREPANSAWIGLQNQQVLEACYESARTQRQVLIEDVLAPASTRPPQARTSALLASNRRRPSSMKQTSCEYEEV